MLVSGAGSWLDSDPKVSYSWYQSASCWGGLGLGNSTGPLVGGAGAWDLWFQDLGIWSWWWPTGEWAWIASGPLTGGWSQVPMSLVQGPRVCACPRVSEACSSACISQQWVQLCSEVSGCRIIGILRLVLAGWSWILGSLDASPLGLQSWFQPSSTRVKARGPWAGASSLGNGAGSCGLWLQGLGVPGDGSGCWWVGWFVIRLATGSSEPWCQGEAGVSLSAHCRWGQTPGTSWGPKMPQGCCWPAPGCGQGLGGPGAGAGAQGARLGPGPLRMGRILGAAGGPGVLTQLAWWRMWLCPCPASCMTWGIQVLVLSCWMGPGPSANKLEGQPQNGACQH